MYTVYRVGGHDPYALDEQMQAMEARNLHARAAREEWERDLLRLMGEPWGRRIVRRLLDAGQLDDPVFHTNYGQMCLLEGRRQYAVDLRKQLRRLCPERLFQLEREADGSGSGNDSNSGS